MSHKIKALISAVFCLIFLCSCNADKEVKSQPEIPYETGSFDWDIGEEDAVTDIPVPDKETAIKIAESITSGFQKKGFFPGYVPQHVFFDSDKDVWIVSLWKESENENVIYFGACFSIAIKKDNAEVIKMWVGE